MRRVNEMAANPGAIGTTVTRHDGGLPRTHVRQSRHP